MAKRALFLGYKKGSQIFSSYQIPRFEATIELQLQFICNWSLMQQKFLKNINNHSMKQKSFFIEHNRCNQRWQKTSHFNSLVHLFMHPLYILWQAIKCLIYLLKLCEFIWHYIVVKYDNHEMYAISILVS